MDKLLDKVEPGCPGQPPEGAALKPEPKETTLLMFGKDCIAGVRAGV